MNAAETPARRLLLVAAAAWPAWAAGQPLQPDAAPGGVESAWPLGIIVALVALMFALGALAERRRRRSRPGPPAGGR